MAAIGSTITSEDLTLAGVQGDLAVALAGLTWAEARAKLTVVLALAAGNEGLRQGGVASYTFGGRTVQTSLAQFETAMRAVKVGLEAASSTGGIIPLPLEWGI